MSAPGGMSSDMWALLENSADGNTCEYFAYMFWKCPNSKIPFATGVLDCMYAINTQLKSAVQLEGGGAPALIVADEPFSVPLPVPVIDEETGELTYCVEPSEYDAYRERLRSCLNDLDFYGARLSEIVKPSAQDGEPVQVPSFSAVYAPLTTLSNLIEEHSANMSGELSRAVHALICAFFDYLKGLMLDELKCEIRPLKRSEPTGGLPEITKKRFY